MQSAEKCVEYALICVYKKERANLTYLVFKENSQYHYGGKNAINHLKRKNTLILCVLVPESMIINKLRLRMSFTHYPIPSSYPKGFIFKIINLKLKYSSFIFPFSSKK